MSPLIYNNSSNSSNNFRDEFNHYVANVNHILLYIQAVICSTGLLGNLLALIVINRKSLKNTSSAVFIIYMAIFDSMVLLSHAANLARPRRNLFLHCSLTYLTDLSTLCANWVLIIITLERCIAVYSPFLAKRLCTVHSSRRSIYILLIIAIIFCSGTFPFIYQIHNTSKSKKCQVRSNAGLILRIYQPILYYLIPDLLLLSNLFTIYALCQRRQRLSSVYVSHEDKLQIRVNDIHSNRKQRQLTIMLVTVSLSFYLFTTPAMIMYITEYQPPKHRQIEKIKQVFLFSQISVILLQLNNATNFIFYCFAGQRFRQATMQLFYYHSKKFKIFYHRYMLCDKQYHLTPIHQHHLTSMGNTTLTNRGSCSPHYHLTPVHQHLLNSVGNTTLTNRASCSPRRHQHQRHHHDRNRTSTI